MSALAARFATVVSDLAPIAEGLGEVPMLTWLLITGLRAMPLERAETGAS